MLLGKCNISRNMKQTQMLTLWTKRVRQSSYRYQERRVNDGPDSCPQLWWWFSPLGRRRPQSEPPALPSAATPTWSSPPAPRDPVQPHTLHHRTHFTRREGAKQRLGRRPNPLISSDANVHPPTGLAPPSWRPRRWTRCCPLGWHDLHWCLWGDAGNAAGEAGEEETGYHGYISRKDSNHGDTRHVEE